jgi:hypothetical protein
MIYLHENVHTSNCNDSLLINIILKARKYSTNILTLYNIQNIIQKKIIQILMGSKLAKYGTLTSKELH